jgi:hypothetical protein
MSTNRASSRKRKNSSAATTVPPKNAASPTNVATMASAAQGTAVAPEDTGWEKEYTYVFGDLRKLLIVSLSLFAIIIVIGFFL